MKTIAISKNVREVCKDLATSDARLSVLAHNYPILVDVAARVERRYFIRHVNPASGCSVPARVEDYIEYTRSEASLHFIECGTTTDSYKTTALATIPFLAPFASFVIALMYGHEDLYLELSLMCEKEMSGVNLLHDLGISDACCEKCKRLDYFSIWTFNPDNGKPDTDFDWYCSECYGEQQ
jgi:hypothetical protein